VLVPTGASFEPGGTILVQPYGMSPKAAVYRKKGGRRELTERGQLKPGRRQHPMVRFRDPRRGRN